MIDGEEYAKAIFKWSTVHKRKACKGRACWIHRPSDHSMRGFDLYFRADRGIVERTCSHGVGHPDPDDITWHESQGRHHEGVHGCDGCCAPRRVTAA